MRNEAAIRPKAKLHKRNGFLEEFKKYKGAYLMRYPVLFFI